MNQKNKTIEKWFASVADPDLRDQLLAHMSQIAKDTPTDSLKKALLLGIQWHLPPGMSHWTKVEERIEKGEVQMIEDRVYSLEDMHRAYQYGAAGLTFQNAIKPNEYVQSTQ